MKRLILTSMLTAAGLLAQQSGSAPTPAPATPAPKAQTTKKHRHKKSSTASKDGTAPAVQSNSSQAPANPAKK